MNQLPVQQKTQTPSQRISSMMAAESVKKQFAEVLKESAGSFMASIIECFNGDTKLAQCEPQTVILEALKAASLKLPLNKSLGLAYLVPFNSKQSDGSYKMVPQFLIGYKGLIQLAIRSGHYKHINAGPLYEGMTKMTNYITGETEIISEPDESKPIVGYFAYIELMNGFRKFIMWSNAKIEFHAKKFSKSYEKGKFWREDYDAMATKTVLRHLLSHYGLLSIEMADAISADDNIVIDNVDVTPNSIPLSIEPEQPTATPKAEEIEAGF
jgi:recombination protein RecT